MQKEEEIQQLKKTVDEQTSLLSQKQRELESFEAIQKELEEKEGELVSVRNGHSVLESRYQDLQQKMNQMETQNAVMKEEFEKQLNELKAKEAEAEEAEVLLLKESNENLKILLNNAEKKYVHLTSLNTELQKRIDLLGQQNQLKNDQM